MPAQLKPPMRKVIDPANSKISKVMPWIVKAGLFQRPGALEEAMQPKQFNCKVRVSAILS